MTQRFYQLAAGRFTQLDPLPESVMLPNRYEYANCNPSNFVDPSGLTCSSAEKGLISSSRQTAFAIATIGYAIATAGIGGILIAAGVAAFMGYGQLGATEAYVDECGRYPY